MGQVMDYGSTPTPSSGGAGAQGAKEQNLKIRPENLKKSQKKVGRCVAFFCFFGAPCGAADSKELPVVVMALIGGACIRHLLFQWNAYGTS
jgi:hypothetical protein